MKRITFKHLSFMFLFLFIVVGAYSIVFLDPPKIRSIYYNIGIYQGHSVKLKFELIDDGGINEIKYESFFMSHYNPIMIGYGSPLVQKDATGKTFIYISIYDAQIINAGKYKLKASNTEGEDVAETDLEVYPKN